MGSGTKIECRHCGRMVTLKRYREEHGPNNPVCLYYKWRAYCYEHNLRDAGRDRAVLELAGVTRILPVGRPYYFERVWVPQEGGGTMPVWKQALVANFVSVAPRWACDLARKLMDDQALVLRFGKFRFEKRSFGMRRQKLQHEAGITEKGVKAVIPLEVRAKIIRIAAQNSMTREFAADDLDVVLTIIRDSL